MASASGPGQVLRFGVFELDLGAHELRKAGTLLRLQPQPFKVLAVLASRTGRIVSREELRRELWGEETFVDFEQGLNYCVRQIRAVLDDKAQTPRYIETLPRQGYRFLVPVEDLSSSLLVEAPAPPPPASSNLRHLRNLVLAAVALALVLAGTMVWTYFPRRPLLTERDSILIAEIENRTGDPIFDATLRKALSAGLGQSPYLNIVSDMRIRESLQLMGKPPDTRVTPEIAVEICKRAGIKAALTGSINLLGSQYVINLEAIDARTGDILTQDHAEAGTKEQVLGALGKSAERLRRKLGESLVSIQHFDKSLEQATTPSLEALQLYTLGLEKCDREGDLTAIPYFERAIQLDPDFALAYARLGVSYANLEQGRASEENENKALALIARVSEREKLYILGHHYNRIGDKVKEIETYESYARLYPRDEIPPGNLAFNYGLLGQYEKSIEHALAGLRLNPSSVAIRNELALSYAALGRVEEARAVVEEGLKQSPKNWSLHLDLSNLALFQQDSQTQAREDNAAAASGPQGTISLLYRDAALAAARGQLKKSRDTYAQARELCMKLHLNDNASFASALEAVYEAYLEDPVNARKSAASALKLSTMADTLVPVAIALAMAGEQQQSEALMGRLARERPDDTFVQFVWIPTIKALVDLNHGEAQKAVLALVPASQYDRANLDPMLARANALLYAKRPAEAIEEYQKMLAQRARFPFDPACALAELGLARAYAQEGRPAESRTAYQDFLSLWQNADSDLPMLKKAKAEYAKLN